MKRGVRQVCVLSPDLFNLYSQCVMEEIQDLDGIKVGGRNVNNLRYADDTVLIAKSKENLQLLVEKLQEACNRKGLKINIDKTEVMVATKKRETVNTEIMLNGKKLKQVQHFKYLGSIITEDGRSEKEIKTRIGIAKTTFEKQKKILANVNMNWNLRFRFLKSFVWSTLSYGCESWTISTNMKKRLEATEMWFLRRMMRISWTEMVTNEEVLRRAETRRSLLGTIRRRQLSFLGHTIRSDELEKDEAGPW